MAELTRYAADRGVATITLDSPANRNALSAQLVAETSEHLQTAATDADVRAIVLAHTGTVFCAGADLREQSADGGPELGTQRLLALLRLLVDLPKPVIARIDGAARAGGVGLVGACDIALASRNATFAFTEVRLGLAPAMISLTIATRLQERAASRYLLTGETFDATTAADIGLLTACTDDLDHEVGVITDALRSCSPQGLAATKPLTTQRLRSDFEERAAELQALSARLFGSEEAREGMQAFFEKRSPRWLIP